MQTCSLKLVNWSHLNKHNSCQNNYEICASISSVFTTTRLEIKKYIVKCTTAVRGNLSDVGFPALVLLRAGVLFKQTRLVGNVSRDAPPAVCYIQHCGCCHSSVIVGPGDRDIRDQGGEAVHTRLRDGGQEGVGVRPVAWIHWELEGKCICCISA